MSASEANQTEDTVSLDDAVIEEVSTENEAGTFSDLERKINTTSDNILELDKDYTYNLTTDGHITYGILINKSITIDGKGHTIDANQQKVIFNYRTPLTIQNIILKNCNGGSPLYENFYTNTKVYNCTFINNHGGQYGALGTHSGTIVNSTFINNSGTTTAAVNLGWGSGSVKNCTFINNTGGAYGALHIYSGKVSDCIFIKNSGSTTAGGVCFNTGGTVENSIFINNIASTGHVFGQGKGAIAFGAANYKSYLINCTFINNTDEYNSTNKDDSKNKFYIDTAVDILNCTFENTNIKIYDKFNPEFTVKFEGNEFIKTNIRNINGVMSLSGNTLKEGFIENQNQLQSQIYLEVPNYVQRPEETLILARMHDDSGNTIFNNISLDFFNFVVDGDEITEKTYTQINGEWFYTISKNLAEGNYTVSIKITNQTGFEQYYGNCTVIPGILKVNNIANYTELEQDITSQDNIKSLERDYALIIQNESAYKNGIVISGDNIVIDGKGHSISGSSFARIFNITGNNVTLRNLTFTDGFGYSGGAIISSANITLEDCKFINNNAVNGGALYLSEGNISNCEFSYNNAKNGAAAYFINSVNIVNSTFANNTGKKGVIVVETVLSITNATFENNTLEDKEIDILLKNDGEVILENVTPKDIKAKRVAVLSWSALNVDFGYPAYIEIDITCENTKINTGTVIVSLNNANYTGDVENGHATIIIPDLKSGTYTANATFKGDERYTNPTATVTFTVNPQTSIVLANDSTLTITDNALNAIVKTSNNDPVENGTCLLFILKNNQPTIIGQNTTNANGIVSFILPQETLKDMGIGKHQVVIQFMGNEESYPSYIMINMTIAKGDAQITANSASYIINYGGTYSATVKDITGKALSGESITFTLNGKNIATVKTDSNGIAKITLTANILKTAKYGSKNMIIKFNGNTYYNQASKTVKINIKKEAVKITAKKKTFKKSVKTKKYTVTLKNSKGKVVEKAKLTLKIKGKTYKATTNSKGKATFKIKKLTKKGKHTATITYKTTANYLKAIKKIKITIK